MENANQQQPKKALLFCLFLGAWLLLTSTLARAQAEVGTIVDDPGELEPGEVLRVDEGEIRQFQLAPNETNLAVATSAGLWIYAPSEEGNGLLLDSTPVRGLWWSTDSSLLAALTDGGSVQLWQMADRTSIGAIEGAAVIATVAWAPDGSQIATGSADGRIEIWDVNAGTVLDTLEGHTDQITTLYWTRDGSQLISAAADGSMRAWQVQVAVSVQPAPTPTATPGLETPPEPISATVQVDRLNIRSGPGTDFERIGTALRGQTLPIFDEDGNCAWVRIQTPDGLEGWIAGTAQFVTLSGPCDAVGQVANITPPAAEPPPTSTPVSVLPLPTQAPQTDVEQPTPTAIPSPSPAAPAETTGTTDPLPPDMGCYLFQNQLGAALTVTITSSDGSFNQTFQVPEGGEVPYCLNPGTYTYTIDAPPPWADINGDLVVQAGERFFFPVRPQG